MAVSQEYIEYIVDQLFVTGPVQARRMFGGAGLYLKGLFFAIIADDVLYLKVNDSNRNDFKQAGMEPFRPYGNDSYAMQYYQVPAEVLEDTELLKKWAQKALSAAAQMKSSTKKKRG